MNKTIIIGLLTLLLPITAFGWFFGEPTGGKIHTKPKQCGGYVDYLKIRPDYIKVKLGSHIFSVSFKSDLWQGDKLISLHDICYEAGDPPIEVTRFSIFPSGLDSNFKQFDEKYNVDEIFRETREGFSLRVSASITPQEFNETASDSLKSSMRPELRKASKKLSSLPKDGNFYVINNKNMPNIKYYIPIDKKFITPSGNPLVYVCNLRNGGAMQCGADIVWKDNIFFSFAYVSETYVPPSKFKEFYYDFLQYMESMEVKEEIKNNKNTGE